MDLMSISSSTPLKCRLQSFQEFPMPDKKMSPSKLAEAGFVRFEESTSSDEVKCCFCDAKFSDWDDEPPQAVHRILNPKCPFMNTPASSHSTLFSELENVAETGSEGEGEFRSNCRKREDIRRQLFPDTLWSSPVSRSTTTNNADLKLPLKPKQGDFLMLFESHRILTFTDPCSDIAAVYAEDGFIYKIDSGKAVCVFCNLQFDINSHTSFQLKSLHREQSNQCPFANLYDVGNVSRCLERKVRDKIRNNFLDNGANDSNVHNVIKHPEFEDINVRQGTYKNWLKTLAHFFPSSKMSECGFYCTCKFLDIFF